jgi:hypothetical protein
MLFELMESRLKELAERWAIPGWVMFVLGLIWDVWTLSGHASTAQSLWGWVHPIRTPVLPPAQAANVAGSISWGLIIPQIMIVFGLLWLSALLFVPIFSVGERALLRKVRKLIKDLSLFVDKKEGNDYAIHFGYDVKFRRRVDEVFSELAAEQIFELVVGDWVVNPQTQTARNIRENVIALLGRLADRLENKLSAPKSKLVGEIQAGRFGMSTVGFSDGVATASTIISLELRVTNKTKIEATVKEAKLAISYNGEIYRGQHNLRMTTLVHEKRELLDKITYETPIKQGIATEGKLEFFVNRLKRPASSVVADVSVVLIDEFDVPHVIRNKTLRIAS